MVLKKKQAWDVVTKDRDLVSFNEEISSESEDIEDSEITDED